MPFEISQLVMFLRSKNLKGLLGVISKLDIIGLSCLKLCFSVRPFVLTFSSALLAVAASETISSISSAACSSPSSSEDSGFPTSNTSEGGSLLRESVSPRGPLPYYESEFLNSDIFGSFDPSASSIFSHVKPEPSCFSFSDNSFNLLTEPFDSRTLKSLPRPPLQDMNSFNIDINSPIPSPGFLSPGLMADLPILSPGTGTWSQPLLDCLNANPLQNPAQRQRYSGGYSPSPGNMVALSNIQAFMLS